MMKHDDFRKGGKVSVWLGNLNTDVDLDDYINMRRDFEKDFGFELNERDMPETSVEAEAVSIRKLVNGFSWSESYADAVCQLADERGIKQATTIVIFLNFEYQPERAKPNQNAPLKFLGTVNFGSST